MSSENKKSVKQTTVEQFNKLIGYMAEFPHLATSSPTFGVSRADMEHTWNTVAQELNLYGPPERTGSEWKKVWIDQKNRLKKKIAENNRRLQESGGGPCVLKSLTALERDIDRICHFSSAAAPSGKSFGVSADNETMNNDSVTPPCGNLNNAVVSPTTSQRRKIEIQYDPDSAQSIANSEAINQPNRKRKIMENDNEKCEQIKLLKKQLEVQEETLHAINAQAEAAKATATAVKDIAQSANMIAQSLVAIVNHLKNDNYQQNLY